MSSYKSLGEILTRNLELADYLKQKQKQINGVAQS